MLGASRRRSLIVSAAVNKGRLGSSEESGKIQDCGSSLAGAEDAHKMFQSTNIQAETQRPVILHAYGGAKVNMEAMLQLLKCDGWVPFAAAMIGTQKKLPAWATEDLRVVAGTSLDVWVLPTALSTKEDLLLLSRWHRCYTPIQGSALATWLKDVNKERGPDSDSSPHQPVDHQSADFQNTSEYILQESGFGLIKELANVPRKDRDVTIELGLLLLAYDVKERNLAVLVSALLAGSTPAYFPIQMWQRIAWLALEETASFTLRNDREWRDAYVVLQEVQDTVAVVRNCVRSEEHGSMNATKSSGSCGGRVA